MPYSGGAYKPNPENRPVFWLPFGYPRYKKMSLVAKTIHHTECRKDVAYQHVFTLYKMQKNGKSTTRNEKVACSSQVTSSKKNAVFKSKTAFFLTFLRTLKGTYFCLALIWRYFFETSILEQN